VPIYKEDHERKPDTFDLVSGGAKVLNSLSYLKTFVNIHTSMIVSNASLLVLITDRVFSQHLLNTPSTPVTPMPSIMSLVRRNGTYKQGEKKRIWFTKEELANTTCRSSENTMYGSGSSHTRSGVLSMRPCSNATPRSMCTTSAVS
jgi:hypothetical protein